MNTIDQDTFMNVLSFLQPTELCRMRYLNKWMNRECDQWLIQQTGTKCLESVTCPKCGDFMGEEKEREIRYHYYYDILYDSYHDEEHDHRKRSIEQLYKYAPEVKRFQLLCDDCDTFEDEDMKTEGIKMWRYRGNRTYYVKVMDDEMMNMRWAALIQYDNNEGEEGEEPSSIRWNEYRCFISPISEEILFMPDPEFSTEYEAYMIATTYNT